MSSIILLFLCLLIGICIQKVNSFPKNTAVVLNQYILFVALPAMALHYLPKIKLSWELLLPAAVAWITFGLSFLLFSFLGKRYGWSKKLTGCLIITSGLGNTSFVGIPVIQALYGDQGLNTLIIVDLPGTFVVLSTLGVMVATLYSSQKGPNDSILKKMFSFPPLIAFLTGLVMVLLDTDFPEALSTTFKQVSATISPVALISVGYQLKFKTYGKHFRYLLLGLLFQLIIVPLVILVLFHYILGKTDLATKVCIIEAAMAPMITGAIIASNYGLKPELSNMMVGYGIPVSFLTIAGWYFLIENLLI